MYNFDMSTGIAVYAEIVLSMWLVCSVLCVQCVTLLCVCRAVTDYRSMSYVSADVNRLRLYVIRSVVLIQLFTATHNSPHAHTHTCLFLLNFTPIPALLALRIISELKTTKPYIMVRTIRYSMYCKCWAQNHACCLFTHKYISISCQFCPWPVLYYYLPMTCQISSSVELSSAVKHWKLAFVLYSGTGFLFYWTTFTFT